MLKTPASCVLPSKASSTGTLPPHISAARTNVVLLIRRTVRPRGYASGFDSPAALLWTWRVLARQGWVGENVGLFEQPAWIFSLVSWTCRPLPANQPCSPGHAAAKTAQQDDVVGQNPSRTDCVVERDRQGRRRRIAVVFDHGTD